jgi:hypothetical protein
LAKTEWAGHIRAVIRVNRDVLTRSAATGLWRATSETAVFVSNIVLPAAVCANAIRDHWSIENRSHYVRDGSFAEDDSRIRCNPGIFARLRSFATNILRFNGVRNVSDGRHRIAFGGIRCNPRHARHEVSVEQPWGERANLQTRLAPGTDVEAMTAISGR